MAIKLITGIIICILSIGNTFGQLYDVKLYQDDNGLAQNYVYSLSQDKNGFLLIGTGEGFNIFDGNRFHTFTQKDGLAENFVTCHITLNNRTVIGHFQGGITVFKDHKFTRLKFKELQGVKINGLMADKYSDIIIYTQGKGIFKLTSGNKLQECPNPLSAGINHILYDNANNYLVGTNDGLVVMNYDDPKKGTEITVPEELKYKTISRIERGNKQGSSFWIGVEGAGLYLVIKQGASYQIYDFIPAAELGVTECLITSMTKDSEQNLWLGFLGEGIRKIVFTGTDKNSFMVKNINSANGIDDNNIQTIFEDKEGNIWLGTFGGGLYLKTIQPFVYYTAKNGLQNANIRSVASDNKGTIWLGTEAGLKKYNLASNIVTSYNASNGFVNDEVSCLMQRTDGQLWVGTRNNGVYIFDHRTGKFTSFSKEKKMLSKTINSIAQTAYGMVYIGTAEGLYIYDSKANTLRFLTTMEGLLHNNVRYLFTDSQNRLWVASPGSPPYYYAKGKFTICRNIEGLNNYKIISFDEDRTGQIWIATEGDGVFCFKNGKFTNYTISQGIRSNYIYGVLYDGDETVWLTHKDGLSRINIISKKVSVVDRTHGNLRLLENNLNSTFRDSDHLFFGTTQGLVTYLNRLRGAVQKPITSIVSIAFDDFVYRKFTNLEMKYKKYNVTINYKGVAFSDQGSVIYKYRLLGLDDEWRITTNDFVDFPKLGDGTYTFQVMASTLQGKWSSGPIEVQFTINPPVWKTWWFSLIILICIVFFIVLIIRYRISTLSAAKMRLEKQVEQATRELQEEKRHIEIIKDELEEKNSNITDSINYALRIQKAILPETEDIRRCFPDSTILYQPRDIVSGDFHWFHESERYLYYALVDCTGHGIPGAFMSLIGSTLLNEIVSSGQDETPAAVLNKLHKRIITTLKQDSGNMSRDGMDMILCRYEKGGNLLQFSSAGRPLYHVSKGRLNAYRASLASIGGSYDFIENKFENQEIRLKSGDMIALFSDGYPDQFGESIPKKFSTKRVKDLCLRIADKPGNERAQLIAKAFFDWKGNAEQIDDVIFVTVKITENGPEI